MSELSKLVRHWAASAALTSEQRSCLSVEQLNWIADELESRTLTVKLPASRNVEMMSDLTHNSAIKDCQVALSSACTTAGIKLQIEGE